jgi:hypothetical protein
MWQLSVDVASNGNEILTSSKGFNSTGCEAKVRPFRQPHYLNTHKSNQS